MNTIANLHEVVFHFGLAEGERFLDRVEQTHGPEATKPLWDEWERLAADNGKLFKKLVRDWEVEGPPGS